VVVGTGAVEGEEEVTETTELFIAVCMMIDDVEELESRVCSGEELGESLTKSLLEHC